MKKDGIQTRNRKLSAKSKKKRGTMQEFLAPFEARSFSAAAYAGMGAAAAATGYFPAMSQYYGMGGMGSGFASAAAGAAAAGMYSSGSTTAALASALQQQHQHHHHHQSPHQQQQQAMSNSQLFSAAAASQAAFAAAGAHSMAMS